MTHLRKLPQLFRRAIATVAFGQGAPQSAPIVASRLAMLLIAAATLAGGCTDASSPKADEPTVVEVVWTDGRRTRLELSSPEVSTEQEGDPEAFLVVKNGEVKEFVESRFARVAPEAETTDRPDESATRRLVDDLMRALPGYSELDRLSGEDLDRATGMLQRLSAETAICLEGLSELRDSLTAVTSRGN